MPTILVADDNTNIQKMVSLSFEDRGIDVVAVGNGEAAVRRIPDVNPDLVLADIFMPVRNGYEVCEFVKKDERFSHVPVILLVGAFDPLDEKEARRVGADGVLKKPFVPPDPLIAMVTSALEKNPKIAFDLAQARSHKAAPPEPLHIPEPSNSPRAEVKPLPEFPEPASAEEQALVYGYGAGRRDLDNASAKPGGEPQAPLAEPELGTEQDFDSSRDWRRNAMDFNVPADVANQPAFASDPDPDSSMFPSERHVPPRHVRIPELASQPHAPIEEPRSLHQNSVPKPEEATPSVRPLTSGPDADFFESAEASAMEQVAAEHEAAPEPESTTDLSSESAHWMDTVAKGPSTRTPSDWIAALSEQAALVSKAVPPQAAPPPLPAPLEASEPQADLHMKSGAPASLDKPAVPQEAAADSFFADEPASNPPDPFWPLAEAAVKEPAEAVIETTARAPLPIPHATSDQGLASEPNQEPPVGLRDPDLFEAPAIHAVQEPLLVEEEPPEPSHYGSMAEELQPLHAFLSEIPQAPPVHEPEIAASADHEPDASDKRIPTASPPNREALSHIPFLTPPPEVGSHTAEPAAASSDTVDAVVRKVLEKLEPQLHDLLSQGVLKPLVENILQNEAPKKK